MGTAETESPLPAKSVKNFEVNTKTEKKKSRLRKSPTPLKEHASRDSSSMTPTRNGRSLTPLSLYLIRRSTDPADPPKWRSITPFLDRKNKEKTPFELGTNLKAQLIAHKMVFDRASVMDITDESIYEPGRFITSDTAVIDRASVMDISNVEVVYLIEELEEPQDLYLRNLLLKEPVETEVQTIEKKKSKRVKKQRPIATENSEISVPIEKEVSPSVGSVEKKTVKLKKKIEKKKKVKEDSDDDLSPPPTVSPPKLSLKLELGGGSKMNKKMFEMKATESETKPPVKKTKQELEQTKAKTESIVSAKTDSQTVRKVKKKSIVSLGDSDTESIKSKSKNKKRKSRTASIADDATTMQSRKTSSNIDDSEINELQSNDGEGSLNDENNELQSNVSEENDSNVDRESLIVDDIENSPIEVNDDVKESTPTPPKPRTPTPPRRSPSPAFPPKQPESYYNKIRKNFGEKLSSQIKSFNSVKRNKPHHPAFIVKLSDLCVTETENIRISCAVYGPNLTYKWFKDDLLLEPSDRINFIEDENILTLQILDSRPKDTADYKLKVFNEYKIIECVSYVNVAELGGYQDEPCSAYIESMEDYFHYIDDKLMIECKVKGIPRAKLIWYKEDMQIQDWMTQYTLVEEPHGRCILIVNHPTVQDIGNYTLHAQNDRGSHIRKHCVQFLARRPTTSSKLNYRAWNFLC